MSNTENLGAHAHKEVETLFNTQMLKIKSMNDPKINRFLISLEKVATDVTKRFDSLCVYTSGSNHNLYQYKLKKSTSSDVMTKEVLLDLAGYTDFMTKLHLTTQYSYLQHSENKDIQEFIVVLKKVIFAVVYDLSFIESAYKSSILTPSSLKRSI